jgi:hypothetical protein
MFMVNSMPSTRNIFPQPYIVHFALPQTILGVTAKKEEVLFIHMEYGQVTRLGAGVFKQDQGTLFVIIGRL